MVNESDLLIQALQRWLLLNYYNLITDLTGVLYEVSIIN